MLKESKTNQLEYQKLSKEEMESRGILGRLIGICADFKNGTRNSRLYSEDLWEKVFDSPIMKEKIKNKVCYGELGHPVDREEIDMEKVAVCLAEQPVKGKDGKLRAVFDILSTPNGKLLKALCDYGSTLGISSRGTGEVIDDGFGNESVDPDSYVCETFDVVLVPAVESARLTYVTESLENKKSLRESLEKTISESSEEDQAVMKETLKELNIDYQTEKSDDINDTHEEETVESNEVDESNELLEALKSNEDLRKQIAELQEKLSVSYTKEAELTEKLSKYQGTVSRLSKTAMLSEGLKQKTETLEKSVEENKKLIESKEEEISKKNNEILSLKEKYSTLVKRTRTSENELNESKSEVKNLKEQLKTERRKSESIQENLNKKIQDLQGDLEIKTNEYNSKIAKANKVVESYKSIADQSIERYVESQARRLGMKPIEIKSRLEKNYSFDEIDSVCEDLQKYKLNISKLPFNFDDRSVKVKVNESKDPILARSVDDSVDDDLYNLAKIKQ